jgi:hypothetical protein
LRTRNFGHTKHREKPLAFAVTLRQLFPYHKVHDNQGCLFRKAEHESFMKPPIKSALTLQWPEFSPMAVEATRERVMEENLGFYHNERMG